MASPRGLTGSPDHELCSLSSHQLLRLQATVRAMLPLSFVTTAGLSAQSISLSRVHPWDEGDATSRGQRPPGTGRAAGLGFASTQAGARHGAEHHWSQPQPPVILERPHHRPIAMRQLCGSPLLSRGTTVVAARKQPS